MKLSNDDGRNAWVGLVFHDRNAAFDFYLKFDEYFDRKNKKNEEFKIDTNVDFSLKTGRCHQSYQIIQKETPQLPPFAHIS